MLGLMFTILLEYENMQSAVRNKNAEPILTAYAVMNFLIFRVGKPMVLITSIANY